MVMEQVPLKLADGTEIYLTPGKHYEMESLLKDCTAKRIYTSAFPNFTEFKRHTPQGHHASCFSLSAG